MAALPGLLLPFLHPAGHVGGVAAQLRGLRRTSGDSGGPGGAGGQSPPPQVPGGRRNSPEGAGPGRGGGEADPAGSVSFPAQGFLSRNTRGRGYWLGLRAVRRARQIQGYQWVDGVPLSFR